MAKEDSTEMTIVGSPTSGKEGNTPHDQQKNLEREGVAQENSTNTSIEKEKKTYDTQKEECEMENSAGKNLLHSPMAGKERGTINFENDDQELEDSSKKNLLKPPTAEMLEEDKKPKEMKPPSISEEGPKMVNVEKLGDWNEKVEKMDRDEYDIQKEDRQNIPNVRSSSVSEKDSNLVNESKLDDSNDKMGNWEGDKLENQIEDQEKPDVVIKSSDISKEGPKIVGEKKLDDLNDYVGENRELKSVSQEVTHKILEEVSGEEAEPVFDGTEVPGLESNRSESTCSLDLNPENQGYAWPEKGEAFKNFVRVKSSVAVSVLRRLSGKSNDVNSDPDNEDKDGYSHGKELVDSLKESEAQEVSQRAGERFGWNPLSLIKISRDGDAEKKAAQHELVEELAKPSDIKGRVILYTRIGCQDCKEARRFLRKKRLRYVEINIDVYPSRKQELEKFAGSSAVPRVLFNDVVIGGLGELYSLDELARLDEKIEYVVMERPSSESPLPPFSGEDDMSSAGAIDELAIIVQKMKESVVIKDRFYRMRRFTNSFLGSEAVDFLSDDQYLERVEAVEFGRKLASKLFFQHVLDENVFEDGNHLYRFLDHDPIVMSQCHNIPKGIIELKPRPIIEISSRLRYLSYAIFEAYTSENGRHVDYRSIHGSEEFARYLRIVEELQRVDLQDMPREEKLAFFINLHNMMAIHSILLWGHPAGALERRKMLGDFKYVVGGCTYSLSGIQNGILRGNQRPPYNLVKPFGVKDRRFKVALPYPEPLIHFALVCGNRSGPALRCYSPGNIDKELVEAACDFIRSGGLLVDLNEKAVSVSKILKWYSVDFGKSEVEVLKHAANYMEPADSEKLLELLSTSHLKVVYQPYDWGLNS